MTVSCAVAPGPAKTVLEEVVVTGLRYGSDRSKSNCRKVDDIVSGDREKIGLAICRHAVRRTDRARSHGTEAGRNIRQDPRAIWVRLDISVQDGNGTVWA